MESIESQGGAGGKPPAPLLAAKGISKRFGAVQALTDVDFEVGAGEVVALVGDNGAGKSTLIKAIAGSQPSDGGEFTFEGQRVTINTPQDAVRLGIATVYQDLALCDNLDVVENLYLGRERVATGVLLDEVAMERHTRELLDSLAVTTLSSVRTEVGALSGGQRQSVAIARSLLGEPRLVVLDEPTAALGVAQTEQVLDLIGRLRERGLGVVVISHNLRDVFDVADRIIVLRLGRRAATFDRRSSSESEVVAAITGANHDGNGNGKDQA
ncbi:MAG TPA: ATP-binding cassette domain-containing protein [Solirubrobacteraceae bacterium]|nr:ATP-binding cassette domain-containing protein [Solirubrobacteraceae bacterium]